MCAPSAICWSARLQWYTRPQGVIPFRPRPILPILPPILPIPALYYTPPILHIPALYYTPPILPIPARPIPSLSFRPLCCRYVGLIKPNSAHCIIICVLPIYLREQASWPPLITFNIELLPGSSMHHTRGRLQDYNSILPNSKRSFFTSRSGVCREYPAWLKPMKNRQMCFLKTPFSPMPLLNLVIVDMQHASSHKNHKSREIHIFEKK